MTQVLMVGIRGGMSLIGAAAALREIERAPNQMVRERRWIRKGKGGIVVRCLPTKRDIEVVRKLQAQSMSAVAKEYGLTPECIRIVWRRTTRQLLDYYLSMEMIEP